MVSEKQIDTVARMLDPDAFTLEKTMLIMKGEMFGHHGERVRAARGKAEELLTAAKQAETAPEAEPERKWPAFVYDSEAEPNMRTRPTPSEPATDAEPYLWLHPWNGSTSKCRSDIAADCPKDGPQPIPLYTHPSPSEAQLREALEKIVGRDSYIDASTSGNRKVIYGDFASIARAALAQGADDERS